MIHPVAGNRLTAFGTDLQSTSVGPVCQIKQSLKGYNERIRPGVPLRPRWILSAQARTL